MTSPSRKAGGWAPVRRTRSMVSNSLRVWSRLMTRGTRSRQGDIPYRGQVATGHVPLLMLLAFPVVVVLFVRLAPWAWLMWVMIAVSAVAFAWLVALYASFLVVPHHLGRAQLELHYGLADRIAIPVRSIDRVVVDIWDATTEWDGMHRSDDGFVVSLPVAHQTQVAILLHEPLAVGSDPMPTVRVIRFAADDPEAAARLIASRIEPVSR